MRIRKRNAPTNRRPRIRTVPEKTCLVVPPNLPCVTFAEPESNEQWLPLTNGVLVFTVASTTAASVATDIFACHVSMEITCPRRREADRVDPAACTLAAIALLAFLPEGSGQRSETSTTSPRSLAATAACTSSARLAACAKKLVNLRTSRAEVRPVDFHSAGIRNLE